MQQPSALDSWLHAADATLRVLFAPPHASAPYPPEREGMHSVVQDASLTEEDKRLAGALMRVNHVGEICAQALYQSQALATRDPELRAHFEEAAREEMDHLAWVTVEDGAPEISLLKLTGILDRKGESGQPLAK